MENLKTYSLFIIKPGFIDKESEITKILEENDIKVVKREKCLLPLSRVEKHYSEHLGKPFYNTLVGYMTNGNVGDIYKFNPNCVKMIVSSTRPNEAEDEFITRSRAVVKEIIRPRIELKAEHFDLSPEDFKELKCTANGLHASDCAASAEREINNMFPCFEQELEK